MKGLSIISLFLGICFASCDTDLQKIITYEEVLEFENDSSFVIKRFVSKLPIIVIQTDDQEIPDDPRIAVSMGIIFNGDNRFNRYTDGFNDFEGPISIERRGSTSQNFPKLQYAFETLDDKQKPLNVELLGLPEENDWILYAPYSDKSMIRNVVMYKWWRNLGHYTSRTRFCELVVDGEYEGIYILMEQIKWGKDRVDIERMDEFDNNGDSLTGGYIFKIDKTSGRDGGFDWKTKVDTFDGVKTNVSFQYDYPKASKITKRQGQYIQGFVHEFEYSLESSSFDGKNGYRRYAEPASFIDFFFLQEIAHNVDGYRNSTFLYKQRDSKGGKLSAGPIWDFNLALGNTTGCEGELAEGWALDHPCDPTVIPFWWKRMAQDSVYVQQLRKRWWELRKGDLSNKNIFSDIDEAASELGNSVERNNRRWNLFGVHIWPNNFVGNNHEEDIGYLKDWILQRLEWMDANIQKPD